ncbi:MAG: cytochrome c, partial [Desulfobacterales bacterium]|nr:cytochrome c [Desulfobacterales bacterium]
MNKNMKIFLAFLVVLCLLVGGIAVFVWWGGYNVAATVPHWKVTRWFLEEVRERSISSHSKGVDVPSSKDPKLIEIGLRHYHSMRRLCHNAPGCAQTEITQGLNPRPPDFTRKEIGWGSEAELCWVIKNGIKMTGMPAFGPTHSEDELWGVVAFLKKLPSLKPEEYKAMVKAA